MRTVTGGGSFRKRWQIASSAALLSRHGLHQSAPNSMIVSTPACNSDGMSSPTTSSMHGPLTGDGVDAAAVGAGVFDPFAGWRCKLMPFEGMADTDPLPDTTSAAA